MSGRNYDTVAGFYDGLSRLVFGSAQVKAQLHLLPHIPCPARVLIVGGGTGWILEEIAKIHPSGLSITYVDASAKMMAISATRNVGQNKVTFITAAIENATIDSRYDVVITPFLFDNFTEGNAGRIFLIIDQMLRGGGLWLYCDFRDTSNVGHRLLLKAMYTFFKLCCGIKATRLPAISTYFAGGNYSLSAHKTFMNGFITSDIYTKP